MISLLVIGLIGPGAVAQSKPVENQPQSTANSWPQSFDIQQISKNKNNINLNKVQLRAAFRTLADLADLNVIVDDSSVQGTVTAHLTDVSVGEAIKLLVKTQGLKYKVIDDTIIIGSAEKLRSGFGNQVTKVFKLNNADPKQIKRNLSLITDKEVIEINDRSNSLVIKTYQSKLPELRETINRLDQPRKQVIIQARLEEISQEGLKELGIDWSFGDLKINSQSDQSTASSRVEVGDVTIDYETVLQLLEKSSQSTTLANPRLTTVDGKTATINIGESIPIVKVASESTQVEFKDVGINLEITPRITSEDEIYVDVSPEVSVVNKYLETKTAKYPVIGTRKAQTSVRITDGQTIAIGGLIKEDQVNKSSQLPVLGDLPVVGGLFTSKINDSKKQELVIFITPKIVNSKSSTLEPGDSKNKKIIPTQYRVKKGDTLWQITNLFNLSFVKTINYNDSELIENLEPGSILELPIPATHYYLIQAGDTILQIAKEYSIDPEVIKKINGIDSLINKSGQKLIMPVKVKLEDRINN